MPSFRIVTDAAVEAACQGELAALEASKAARYSVLPRVNAQGMTGAALRLALLATPADYTLLIGDGVPSILLVASPDGHTARKLLACKLLVTGGALVVDSAGVASGPPGRQPYGAISRVWYFAQPGAGVSSIELYRAWLTRAALREQNALAYRVAAVVDDHFDYVSSNGSDYRAIGASARAAVPAHLLEDLRELPAGADNTDGVWARWAARPVMVGYSLSGGYEFESLTGLYTIGRTEELRRIRPVTDLHVIWGSYQMDYGWQNNLPLAVTTIEGCTTAVLDQYGQMDLARYFAGRPIGDASRAFSKFGHFGSAEDYLLDIIGDCTQQMTDSQLAISDVTARVAALETWRQSLGGGAVAGSGTVSGAAPTVVVTSAVYRVKNSPGVTNDLLNPGKTLAYVQKQAAAGLPVASTDAQGDPWPGQLKELVIAGTRGGVAFQQTIAEGDSAVL